MTVPIQILEFLGSLRRTGEEAPMSAYTWIRLLLERLAEYGFRPVIAGVILVLAGCVVPVEKMPERDKMSNTHLAFSLDHETRRDLTEKANKGDGSAAFRLAQYYELSAIDTEKELKWLRIAANLGHPIAQYNLAYVLIRDEKYRNLDEAEQWLNRAERSTPSEDQETRKSLEYLRKDFNAAKDKVALRSAK